MKTFPAIYIDSQGELKCITDVNQSAIPVSGDEYKQIPSDYYERLKGMEIVEIPEGWRVEVLAKPVREGFEKWNYERVAVLIPPSQIKLDRLGNTDRPVFEGESQEEIWSSAEDIVEDKISKCWADLPTGQLTFNIVEALKERFTIQRRP